jgi:hypothetical protein
MQAAHRRPKAVDVAHIRKTGEPMLDLVAAIFRRAVRDTSGRTRSTAKEAERFLDCTFPEWRRFQEGMIEDE